MSEFIKGLGKVEKSLSDLSSKAKKLGGKHSVKLADLFPTAFMRRFTAFQSIDEMFAKSGYKVTNGEDLKAIPDEAWDKFVATNTKFKNWAAMQEKATAEWAKKALGI